MDRIVLRWMCDDVGEITYLCGSWGAVDRAEAIRQIDSREHTYTLARPDGSRARFTTTGPVDSKRLFVVAHGDEVLRHDDAMRIGA
jgi:hypothetical protein